MRRRYRKAMLTAIEQARHNTMMKTATKASGLRCIREFEKINGVDFDPFDRSHVFTVSGMAPFCQLFRHLRIKGLLT